VRDASTRIHNNNNNNNNNNIVIIITITITMADQNVSKLGIASALLKSGTGPWPSTQNPC